MNFVSDVSFIGLVLLFIIAEVCSSVLNIRSNSFYNYFHFTGGALTFIFIFSLTGNHILSLLATEAVGILWEIYEWARWKFFQKKKIYQPELTDTRNDLLLDLFGAIVMYVMLLFLT